MATKKREEYKIDRAITIDGNKSELVIKVSFDTEKGTIAIQPKITTKHLSFDDVQRQALLQQVANMTAEAYDFAIDLLQEFLRNNRPEAHGQTNMFDGEPDDPDYPADIPQAPEHDPEPEEEGERPDGEASTPTRRKVKSRKAS